MDQRNRNDPISDGGDPRGQDDSNSRSQKSENQSLRRLIATATIQRTWQPASTTTTGDERQQILRPSKTSADSTSIFRASNKVDDTRGKRRRKRMSNQCNSTHGSISESALSGFSGVDDQDDEQSHPYYQGASFNNDLDLSAYNRTGMLVGAVHANHAISESSFRTTTESSSNTT